MRNEVGVLLGVDCSDAILASAKQRVGIDEILEAVVARVPPPQDTASLPLRALIFDSYYDPFRGVIVLFRVVDGVLRKGALLRMMNTGAQHEARECAVVVFIVLHSSILFYSQVLELGVSSPGQKQVPWLGPGEVGYLAANIKRVADARVGDTVTLAGPAGAAQPLPGYAVAQPMVFAGLYPTDADAFELLRESLARLQLNDAALRFEPETSSAMGFGFRCGFLGLLHMESARFRASGSRSVPHSCSLTILKRNSRAHTVVQQRLEREYGLSLIATAPSVSYRVTCSDGSVVSCDSPHTLPPAEKRSSIEEPFVNLEVLLPTEYMGAVMELAKERRGEFGAVEHLSEARVSLRYAMPLSSVVTDLFDELKSRTKGYATMQCASRRGGLSLLRPVF